MIKKVLFGGETCLEYVLSEMKLTSLIIGLGGDWALGNILLFGRING